MPSLDGANTRFASGTGASRKPRVSKSKRPSRPKNRKAGNNLTNAAYMMNKLGAGF